MCPETTSILDRLRQLKKWPCQTYVQSATPSFTKHCDTANALFSPPKSTILQWYCDMLTTKMSKLAEYCIKRKEDASMLQENRLGLEDPTQSYPIFMQYALTVSEAEPIRRPSHLPQTLDTKLCATMTWYPSSWSETNLHPTARYRQVSLTNIMLLPSNPIMRAKFQFLHLLNKFSTTDGLMYRDFSAYLIMQDGFVTADLRRQAL